MTGSDERSESDGAAKTPVLALLRADPWLVVPFVLAGLAVGGLEAARLLVEVPVTGGWFPERGVVVLQAPFLPGGGGVVRTAPAMLPGLKTPFLAATLAVEAAKPPVFALATGVFCWRARTGSWLPPLGPLGWLVAYGLAVGAGVAGFALLAPVPSGLTLLLPVALFGVALAVFPLPAALVLDGVGLRAALRRSLATVVDRPVGIAGRVLLAGYAGYLATWPATLAGGLTPAGALLGVGASTAVGGTLLAAVLVTVYRSTHSAGVAAADPEGSVAGAD